MPDDCKVRFHELRPWKQRSLVQDFWVLCNRIMAQPGARAFLDDYERRARAEGRLSPVLLAAMEEPDTQPDYGEEVAAYGETVVYA